MTLPGIHQLESTPEIMRLLMAGITAQQTEWKPAPDRFSIAEMLEHLSHTEAHFFRQNAERMVKEQRPEVTPYDQNAYYAAGIYSGRDAEDSFDHWKSSAKTTLPT